MVAHSAIYGINEKHFMIKVLLIFSIYCNGVNKSQILTDIG